MSSNAASQRELVFCHVCEDEWFKDEKGLVCPRCGSEAVEIISPDTDPRASPEPPPEIPTSTHPLHGHDPWNVPDPDEDDISTVQWSALNGTATVRTSVRAWPAMDARSSPLFDAFAPLLGSILSGPGAGARPAGNSNQPREPGSPGPEFPRLGSYGASYTYTITNGANGVRFTRTGGTGDAGMEDLNGILGSIMTTLTTGDAGATEQQRETPGNPGQGQQRPNLNANPMMQMLMNFIPAMAGRAGDVAHSQEAYDRILTMLRDQHQGSNAPGPASAAAIEALPRIKIAKEHLDEQGNADCAICMDSVPLGQEVMELPCKHWFHEDCATAWLREHDTCPQCRRGITPQSGDRSAPRATGEAPLHWQVNEEDVGGLAREASRGNQPQSSNLQSDSSSTRNDLGGSTNSGSATSSSNRANPSGRLSGVASIAGFVSELGRRFGGSHHEGNRPANDQQ